MVMQDSRLPELYQKVKQACCLSHYYTNTLGKKFVKLPIMCFTYVLDWLDLRKLFDIFKICTIFSFIK